MAEPLVAVQDIVAIRAVAHVAQGILSDQSPVVGNDGAPVTVLLAERDGSQNVQQMDQYRWVAARALADHVEHHVHEPSIVQHGDDHHQTVAHRNACRKRMVSHVA